MSDKGDTSEKRFKATRRRLRRAQRDGDVPRSQDLNAAGALAGWALIALVAGGWGWRRMGDLVGEAIVDSSTHGAGVALDARLTQVGLAGGAVTLALCGGAGLISLLVQAVHSPPVFSTRPLAPDFSRLNPLRPRDGFKPEAWIGLARSLLAAGLLTLALRHRIIQGLPQILALPRSGSDTFLMGLAGQLQGLLWTALGVGLVVGGFDGLYQRLAYQQRLKMTPEEFKRDRKEAEGDPRLKRRRQRLYREWVAHSATHAAQAATAVVTNPTHLAIALHYDPTLNAAPTVTAKGAGELAALIRRAAEHAGVPIIENVALARGLHADSELGDTVPEPLFAAVAEVIVWAHRVRRDRDAAALAS